MLKVVFSRRKKNNGKLFFSWQDVLNKFEIESNGEVNKMENKEVIEINGTKFEIDMTTAKKIINFRVGDVVKVLVKEDRM